MEPRRCPAGDACPAALGGWRGPPRGACRCVRARRNFRGAAGCLGAGRAQGAQAASRGALCLGAGVTGAGGSPAGHPRGSRSSPPEFQGENSLSRRPALGYSSGRAPRSSLVVLRIGLQVQPAFMVTGLSLSRQRILAHTCTASPLTSVVCSKNFCPFIYLFWVTLNSF